VRAEIKLERRFGSKGKRPICQACSKVAYGAAETAVRAAENVSNRTGERLEAYFNIPCGWYHIGHHNGHSRENGNSTNPITREDLETMKVR